MIKHLDIEISGKVQKVGFRFSAIELALELGLVGTVQNREGKVVIKAEGEVDKLKVFLKWCHEGPQGARVDKVDYKSSEELVGYKNFANITEDNDI